MSLLAVSGCSLFVSIYPTLPIVPILDTDEVIASKVFAEGKNALTELKIKNITDGSVPNKLFEVAITPASIVGSSKVISEGKMLLKQGDAVSIMGAATNIQTGATTNIMVMVMIQNAGQSKVDII